MEFIKSVCITADVMNSRKNGKESKLEDIVTHLNNKFKNNLITKFSVRAGDEIFGILEDFKVGYQAFKELYNLSKTHKVPLYVGVGFGDIKNEDITKENKVNGVAIWNSADALSTLKNNKYHMRAIQSLDENFKFLFIVGENYSKSMIVNYLLYFILEKIKKRTPKQTEAIEIIEENPDLNLEVIGKMLDYELNATSNMSKLLKRGEYLIVKEAEQELIQLINLLYEKGISKW